MSIIQEALKKAEEVRGGNKSEAKSFVRTAAMPNVEAVPVHRKGFRFVNNTNKTLLSVLLLSSFIVFIVAISLLSEKSAKRNVSIPINTEIPLKAEAYSEASIVPAQLIEGKAKMEEPGLVLNGIMYLKDSPRAIINDVMVEEGDVVRGARVNKIYEKSVTLELKHAEVTLKLK